MLKVIGIIVLIAFVVAFGVTVGIVAGYMGNLPELNSYRSVSKDQTSKVYAADGTLLTSLHAEQNREIIPLDQIPLNLQRAAIAIEDERFYNHRGVDLKAILRALYTNIKTGQVTEGGSTITQQYVRNSFISPEKTLLRKIKEAALAYQLEKKYSKKKILELYLNTVYFGQGCYGVETAAKTFFGKPAKDLSLAESALLAGLPGAPNYFSPYINPKLALQRRNTVLEKMVSQKYISRKEAEEAKKEPIRVLPIKTEEQIIAPYFVEHVKLSLIDKYGANVVYRGGLRIYTTLDLRMQQIAEEAVGSTLSEPDDPSAALVAIEPKTGYIKALVGGRDFKNNKFNLATQAKRSPGSAFKPFTLAAAIENGISPNKTYDSSSPRNIKVPDGVWRVENYEGRQFSGSMSIREATVWSVNAVYAQLIMDVGAQKVADTAQKMGILTPVPPYPAITLGGLDEGVSPLEMASAYGTLADDGVYVKSTAILKVTDAQGNIIEQNKSTGKQVIGKNTARAVNNILKEVINRGTGTRALLGRPAAGKTGSAEYMQDAWFVGYAPELSTAVWMGYPNGSIRMSSVHGYAPYGGGIPALIWRKFMSAALEGLP
ncbi:MAG: PBP1A family penicillin-binding protein, partial [Actinomycetota bacterium]